MTNNEKSFSRNVVVLIYFLAIFVKGKNEFCFVKNFMDNPKTKPLLGVLFLD